MSDASGWPRAATDRALRAMLGWCAGRAQARRHRDAGGIRGVFRRSAAAAHHSQPSHGPGSDSGRPRATIQALQGAQASGSLRLLACRPPRRLARMGAVYATRLLLILSMTSVAFVPAAVAQTTGRPPVLSAEAFLLLDPEGRTIYAKNAGVERAPASLVKLMTLYLACEAIGAHQIDPDELVTISAARGSHGGATGWGCGPATRCRCTCSWREWPSPPPTTPPPRWPSASAVTRRRSW